MNDENLRKQVKYLKLFQNITFAEIAEYLEVSPNSFYAWIKGQYNFSDNRARRLQEIIANLKEGE